MNDSMIMINNEHRIVINKGEISSKLNSPLTRG